MTETQHNITESADKIRQEAGSKGYQEKKVLQKLYVGLGMKTTEIADLFGCTEGTVSRWLSKHNIETRSKHDYGNEVWKDRELVKKMYNEQELSAPEIADRLNCSVRPIYNRIEETRTISEANKIWTWKLPPKMRTDRDGYEYFQTKINGESRRFQHHRLLAVAEFGFDSVEDNVVHHKKNIPWLNIPSNLEPMSQSEHVVEHFETIPIQDKLTMLEMSENTPATHAEIADTLDRSRSTVNTVIARAKRC